jgi:4-hydroxybenzoate polyprenyltransferase/phosphoserine phosphatase
MTAPPPERPGPICVDLDGTLLATDTLFEGALRLIRLRPWLAFAMLIWLWRGKAFLKARIAEKMALPIEALPVHAELLAWLTAQHRAGRSLWLCTGAPARWAQVAGRHFGIFEGVLCSDDIINLTGHRKRDLLVQRFGSGGFAYCGNESQDLEIWRHAERAVVVGSRRLARQAAEVCGDMIHFESRPASTADWLRALRVHQWSKNVLVFIPLLAAHRTLDPGAWLSAATGFFAFCLAASAMYLLNDLLDLAADREHPSKRQRPIASGRLRVKHAVFAAAMLGAGALAIGWQFSWRFAAVLGGYVVLTLAYSLFLKRVALFDAMVLAGLYTVRLLAGAVLVQVPLSFWLLAFSGFLFFSLALVKRSAELRLWQAQGQPTFSGRGYRAEDLPLVDTIGVTSGLMSALVLALYMNSADVRVLYAHPYALWGLCPLLVWWICRVWLLVHRGRMHDDPVVFALRDRPSLAGAVAGAVLVWVAT